MRNAKITLLLASVLLTACSQKELTSGINKKNMDTLVKPGDNFAAYVNGAWMKTAKIPADKASYGAFDMLYDQSQKDVKAIIEEAAKGNNAEGSDEQKIGDYYASFMDRKGRDAKGVAPIQPELNAIDAIASYDDLAAYFGKANRNGVAIPFNVSVYTDFKDPTKYTLITWQAGLGMPEREYYLATDAKMTDIRKKYVAHIEKMFQLANLPNGAQSAATIMALETTLAANHMKKEDTRDIVKLYNAYAVKDLKTLMPDFNWNAMLKNAGVDQEKKLVVTQVAYTKSLNNIIKSTPIDTWKTYLKWGVINKSAGSLTTALDNQNFEFYGKTLYGTEKQQEDWKRAVETVNGGLGEIVGKVYVKKHFSPEAKERMTGMVKNLLKAYAESIKTLDWMSEATKKEALKKVDNFMIKIGYPDKWRDYSALKIAKNDFYGNGVRAAEFEYNRQLAKLGKPVDRSEWGMNPQTVNAYYNPSLNEIVFPAAILKPPFFDLNADDAVNYGGIGAVIGHEIGHGFDDQGSAFDGKGVMKNWWTPQDLAAFQKKTGALVDQYNSFKAFPDLNVNGAFTLGENIGDLGGLSIAIKAYKATLNGKEAPVMDGFTGMQRVFLGWGQVWAEKSREEALRSQIASDPHSPALFRVNGTVRNIPEFYEAFNIKPTDSLYLAPEKRVKIW
ncbi:peptidase M13 [Flavobacterium sp. J49]|uniref:M13 family metallopeptidase n=1 Tax=Flavobacterium sp. J49 TaxID=2718534 RepID=UPI001594979C|nr:M13-type metalloendopeptidase [Flavobacterium sp. J49]MBF6641589.1 peptidase M13 [Flavobacterium sp. J49]NIC02836.1 peptidase M13 [Flavobacterium sp. J49]